MRVDGVVSLRHFLEEAEDTAPIAPMLPSLLASIFGLMDQVCECARVRNHHVCVLLRTTASMLSMCIEC